MRISFKPIMEGKEEMITAASSDQNGITRKYSKKLSSTTNVGLPKLTRLEQFSEPAIGDGEKNGSATVTRERFPV